MGRYGQALLWAGGLAVALVMTYTVTLDLGRSGDGRRGAPARGLIDVAVVYPERILWQELRQGAAVCAGRKLVTVVEEGEGFVVVRTPKHGRKIRFTLHGVRGFRETKEEVRRVVERPPPPAAVIGSSNTVLTVALAEALNDAPTAEGGGPVLMVPWASSVLAERSDPGEGPVALLDIHARRTFRFCLNNQFMADLIVRGLVGVDARNTPKRVVMVEDRDDPYSNDLSGCFHRAIDRAVPSAEIVERSDSLNLAGRPDLAGLPTPAEEALAESIWRDAEALPQGQTTWVVLPLQELPTMRLIQALTRHARRGLRPNDAPIRVVCGDGVGAADLTPLAGRCPFPVWCVSSASAETLARGVSRDVQIPAEMVAVLALCLDTAEAPDDPAKALREALVALRLKPDDPSAMGRSLAFSRSGERVGDDLGHLLTVTPGRRGVEVVTRDRAGGWHASAVLGGDGPSASAASP